MFEVEFNAVFELRQLSTIFSFIISCPVSEEYQIKVHLKCENLKVRACHFPQAKACFSVPASFVSTATRMSALTESLPVVSEQLIILNKGEKEDVSTKLPFESKEHLG